MIWKPWIKKLTLLIGGLSVYGACSPVEFSNEPIPDKPPAPLCHELPEGCNPKDTYNYQFRIGRPAVDILFVNDNSASMSFEQRDMANRFGDFMSLIEDRRLDYRIAMVTTDISASPNNPPSAANQHGALQDGRLIAFPDGSKFLTPESDNLHRQFAETIRRKETLDCEAWLTNPSTTAADRQNNALYAEKCPSGDERGIYAAYLATSRNEGGWLRDGVPLAVIILSDEDVRSFGENYPTPLYRPEEQDRPEFLVQAVKQQFGNSKDLTVHSIIIPPGPSGTRCLGIQNRQLLNRDGVPLVSGRIGHIYAELSQVTGGVTGDICALKESYGRQLVNHISGSIVDQAPEIPKLACANPENIQVIPASAQYRVEGDTLIFTSNLPYGRAIRVRYSCPRN